MLRNADEYDWSRFFFLIFAYSSGCEFMDAEFGCQTCSSSLPLTLHLLPLILR